MAWRLPDYEPMNLLGSGPTGSVVLSRDRTTGTLVAIKYLSKNVYQAPGFADLFRFEAARLAHFDNPHLALLYEYVEGPETGAVVTEYIDGVSLRALIDGGGALDPQPALYLIKSVLDGLTEPHRKGIAHSDFRPENVLINAEGVPKVVDVGIAASLSRRAPAAGDQRYRAPEMWLGGAASPASDAYAVTTTLFECLTGQPPQTAAGDPLGQMVLDNPAAGGPRTDETVVSGALDDDPAGKHSVGDPPVSERARNATAQIAAVLPPGIAEQIRAVMIKGFALAPEDRAPNAAAMIEELDAAALAAYGAGWEKAGKAKLAYRVAALRTSRRAAALAPVDPDVPASKSWTRTLVAVGAVLVLLIAGVAFASGLFSGNDASASARGVVPDFTHTPMPSTGPTVPPLPNPAATGSGRDTTKPEQPTGLHVIGRSQTKISIDWNPTRDNVRVIGYIVFRNGHQVGTTYLPGYADPGLSPSSRYSYTVVAFDAAGNRSPVSLTVVGTTLTVPDGTPPSVPTGLRSTGRTETMVVLSWAPSRDNVGVVGYDVFRGSTRIGEVIHPGFIDRRLTPGTAYRYSVRAYDSSNNESTSSPQVTVVTLTAPDQTRPSQPSNLTAVGTSPNTIALTWAASSDNVGVTAYNIYRCSGSSASTCSSKSVGNVTGTSFTDFNLKSSTTYHYIVRAVDAAGNLSLKPAKTVPGTTKVQVVPLPAVTGVKLSASTISLATGCTTTISAAVSTVNGDLNVLIDFSINGGAEAGASGSTAENITLRTIDVTTDGSASATVDGTTFKDSVSWKVPDDCVPSQPPTQTPTETPTQPPTQQPTQPPTQPPTQQPTEPPTQDPTLPPTEDPTQPPDPGGGATTDATAATD